MIKLLKVHGATFLSYIDNLFHSRCSDSYDLSFHSSMVFHLLPELNVGAVLCIYQLELESSYWKVYIICFFLSLLDFVFTISL